MTARDDSVVLELNPQLIQTMPLFVALPQEEIDYLTQCFKLRGYPAGSVLFYEGEIGDRFSIIVTGQVDVVKSLETPEERILATLSAGEFLGEMSLLYRDRRRSASARAHDKVRVLEMTSADFDAMLHRQPVLAFRIMQEMSLRLRNTEDATIRDLKEKNAQLAKAYEDLQAAQAALLEKERLEHELRVARRIQERILPKEIPSLAGWHLAAYWQPARAVSGDFYDFIPFPDGRLGIVVGDVTDKGMPAALLMAVTRSTLRAAAHQHAAPGEVLRDVNEILLPDMPANMFVTCLYAVLDPARGCLTYANAGHDLPFLCTESGPVELRATGMPLGLLPDMGYEEKNTCIAAGDSLVLYSDGLVEAHNVAHEMYGFPRLKAHLGSLPRGEACPRGDALVRVLLDALAEFTGPDWEQEDDVTVVTVQRLPEE